MTEAPTPASEPAPQPGSGPTAPSGSGPAAPSGSGPALLDVRDLRVHFPITRGTVFRRTVGHVHAVDGITLGLAAAETVGLVGESGSGKTTLGRAIVGLIPPTSGTILFRGRRLDAKDGGYRAERTQLQMVFQDPTASLDPKWRAGASIAEPLRVNHIGTRAERRQRVRDLLEVVGLSSAQARRYPHELSGGQRQRVAIARALAVEPDVLLADEPVSMLDVSIRLGVLNLLADLRDRERLAIMYVTHDIASARYLADTIVVMYAGEVIEHAPSVRLTDAPAHPYTQLLLSAAPDPDRVSPPSLAGSGAPPSLVSPPSGCRFHPRCPYVMDICRQEAPPSVEIEPGHAAACWLHTSAEDGAASTAAATKPEKRVTTGDGADMRRKSDRARPPP